MARLKDAENEANSLESRFDLAYAHFLGESTDYVLNEVIDTVLAKDKGIPGLAFREQTSFVPSPPASQPAPKRRTRCRADLQPSTAESVVESSAARA